MGLRETSMPLEQSDLTGTRTDAGRWIDKHSRLIEAKPSGIACWIKPSEANRGSYGRGLREM
jgi:hypothetical protein